MKGRLIVLSSCLPVLLYALSLLQACRNSPPEIVLSKVIDVYQPGVDCSTADQLRYTQHYGRAAETYAEVLQSPDLSREDSLHVINQLTYCRLTINKYQKSERQLAQAKKLLDQLSDPPTHLVADHFLNLGRYFYLKQEPDTALQYGHWALQSFYRLYPNGHLRTAQALTLLSLIHIKDGYVTDSIYYYALQTNNFFLNHPSLQKYDWENDFVQGFTSLLSRAHEVGEYHCRAVLEKIRALPFDNPWLEARSLELLGRMLKKRADALVGEDPLQLARRKKELYTDADSLFREAIEIGKARDDEGLLGFYVEWLFNTCRFSDSTYFFGAMDDFERQFQESSVDWRPHYDRMLGYYYFGISNERSIVHYEKFLQNKEDDPKTLYLALGESYYILRVAYRALGNFARSESYAKKSFLLYDCMGEEVDISRPEAILQLDSTKLYCLITGGFLAEGLLMKYKSHRQREDLQLANSYFNFVERHSFKSLLAKDEDAFLSFQEEAGNAIFFNALEGAYEAWTLDQDNHWVNKALNYMEYLKSYLLFRDMLKEPHSDPQAYSLSDSIRILQGQVNQILFSINSDPSEESGDFPQKNLVKNLKRLESRRRSRLTAFEMENYRSQISIDEVRGQLGERRGLVSYYSDYDRFFGIYIDADTVAFFRDREESSPLTETVRLFRESIESEVILDQRTIARYLESANSLYRSLIDPFSTRLNEIDELIIIPDQGIGPIPFEALLTDKVDPASSGFKELPYLLHKAQMVYGYSWKIFALNQEKITVDHRGQSLGFWTTPQLSNVNGLESIEATIRRYFHDNYRIFRQDRNGKQLFAENHHNFDIIHLLLHATSSRINRHDTQVRFGDGPDDVIYGFELYEQKFNAKLLVLASCESAAGTPQKGEGTFSLARSFINSGIPEIVAAQFLIPQTTTGPLLSYFYRHLGDGQSTVRALHLAKIEYLQTIAKERYAYPRFWAGMVVTN